MRWKAERRVCSTTWISMVCGRMVTNARSEFTRRRASRWSRNTRVDGHNTNHSPFREPSVPARKGGCAICPAAGFSAVRFARLSGVMVTHRRLPIWWRAPTETLSTFLDARVPGSSPYARMSVYVCLSRSALWCTEECCSYMCVNSPFRRLDTRIVNARVRRMRRST